MRKVRKQVISIAIVGCGAIGKTLALSVSHITRGQMNVGAVYDTQPERAIAVARALGQSQLACSSLLQAVSRCSVVVEATHAVSAYGIARVALAHKRTIVILSVGGILDTFEELQLLARKHNAQIYVPSGAICGLDGLKAAACGTIRRVLLTTRKPVTAFNGVTAVTKKGIDLSRLRGETVLFEGNVKQAVKQFPQNINVAATLSLAGIGSRRTKVRIVADSRVRCNIHEVSIESDSGVITTRTHNVIHPRNPKTSMLAVLSAQAVLRQMCTSSRVGC